ncbi:hypothetical protein B9Q04_02005 [Candidatus Marsarchaeota G2 archaeon BE_D]|uniref:Uncharacterized protein n=1 Tax=Candidatus Marsarchaeota G2 archaeon BE_D TaxID=1978158 RepID=A0A2R6CE67_9ARCH|nr:MAG: hypothetical protein B9Q04_02005 [Candidatus Marsarchaeota G2 archaeon BE_D]
MRRKILTIASKDIREYLSSRTLVVSLVALPLLISVTIPFFIKTVLLNVPTNLSPQVTRFLPPVLRQALLTMGPRQALYWYMFTVVTLPMFLLLPITSVIVLASDSFAGEKERRTLETLLAEPVSPTTLFLGKTLAPSCVALCVTWVSATVYWALASHYARSVGCQRNTKPCVVDSHARGCASHHIRKRRSSGLDLLLLQRLQRSPAAQRHTHTTNSFNNNSFSNRQPGAKCNTRLRGKPHLPHNIPTPLHSVAQTSKTEQAHPIDTTY